MSAVLSKTDMHFSDELSAPVVVIGTGPVGICFVEELLNQNSSMPVIIYGNEPWEPYNRVRLAGLLTGELGLDGIGNVLKLSNNNKVVQHHNCEITKIDYINKKVYDRYGKCQPYSKLVIATGSTPHVPNIEGINKSGVFTFRDMNDVQKLAARRVRSRKVVVLGGGLLGLEAARGLQKYNTEVTVVEHATRLMPQQLDNKSSEMLREHMLLKRVQVILKNGVKEVIGTEKVEAIKLHSGRKIECDTLVVATGIKPNTRLALDVGIAVGKGIRVNDQMQTNKEDVYAIGECAEHRDKVYGLVAPGLEQAAVAAYSINGGESYFTGSQTATRLKVAGVSVFSSGITEEHEDHLQHRSFIWQSICGQLYRKLIFKRNKLVGVIAYGEWGSTRRIQETITKHRTIWPWQIKSFLNNGELWSKATIGDVSEWPSGTVICQCRNVDRGTLTESIAKGNCSIEALKIDTGASSVCGTCKPLLTRLIGAEKIDKEEGSGTLSWAAAITLFISLVVLLSPEIPFAGTVQVNIPWDNLWRDGLAKQISGFGLLGAAIIVSLISIRKRVNKISFGNFSYWRIVHVVLGCVAVLTLIAHTGFRLGSNLNLYLMLSFLGVLLSGAVVSGAIGLQHLLPMGAIKSVREMSIWTHIILLWPLPVLLGFHVFKSYWF